MKHILLINDAREIVVSFLWQLGPYPLNTVNQQKVFLQSYDTLYGTVPYWTPFVLIMFLILKQIVKIQNSENC